MAILERQRLLLGLGPGTARTRRRWRRGPGSLATGPGDRRPGRWRRRRRPSCRRPRPSPGGACRGRPRWSRTIGPIRGRFEDPLLEPGAGAAEAPGGDDEEDRGRQAGNDDADAAEGHGQPPGEEPDPAHVRPARSAMSMTAWTTSRTRMRPSDGGVAPPPAVVGGEEAPDGGHDGHHRHRAHRQPEDRPDPAGEADDRAQDRQHDVGQEAPGGGDPHRPAEGLLGGGPGRRGVSGGRRSTRRMAQSASERAGGPAAMDHGQRRKSSTADLSPARNVIGGRVGRPLPRRGSVVPRPGRGARMGGTRRHGTPSVVAEGEL